MVLTLLALVGALGIRGFKTLALTQIVPDGKVGLVVCCDDASGFLSQFTVIFLAPWEAGELEQPRCLCATRSLPSYLIPSMVKRQDNVALPGLFVDSQIC